MEIIW